MDLTLFRTEHIKDTKSSFFDTTEAEYIRQHLPEDLADFLIDEGKCSYNNNLLWIVNPKDYHNILKNWGLDGDNMFVFMRSSFGNLVFYYKTEFYILKPQEGKSYVISTRLPILLNVILVMDITLEMSFYIEQHKSFMEKRKEINTDEMLTFVPALPLGGNEDTSEIEVVKLKEGLDNLAQLYNHKTTTD